MLDYKEQVLDALMIEHGAILVQIREQKEFLQTLRDQYAAYNAEYTEKKAQGMTIADALKYQVGLESLEARIVRENERLLALQKQEEQKRAQVVEAKIDTSSIEKLRKIRRGQYDKAVIKQEEAMMDDLVASRRAVGSA